ncbi:ABC transporter permease [Desulfovibrio falkowii]|uniref:ABC transporter permease n=1 Tax=Desulfovibrio falkowii TaxID=3136602 RepID=UPI0038B372B1
MTHAFEHYIDLMREFTARDLKLKYRRSILGYFWSILNPLLMMTILTFVFSNFFRFAIENYPLYVICGQILWSFFNECCARSMGVIAGNGMLIRKICIPLSVFPISSAVSSLITMFFNLLCVIIVMLVTGANFYLTIFLFFIPVFLLFIFSCGFSLALSALALKYKDVNHLFSVVLLAWMYASAIFYPLEIVPEYVRDFILYNPIYIYIDFFRGLVIYGVLPSAQTILVSTVFSGISFVFGLLVFNSMKKDFILYV